jgi:PAS domain S-box-containing protein
MVESVVQSHAEIVVGSDGKKLIRVLHVDDELGLLKVAKQCLEMQGPFHVDTTGSVEEALNKMKEKEYDAVVSDYQMPGKDGLEFLEEIRKSGNSIPFILFTGKGREEVAIRALNLGANRYFNKVGPPDAVYGELAYSVRDAVDKRRILAKAAHQAMLMENVNDAVIGSDGNFVITSWNKAAEGMYGWKAEEVIGKPASDILKTEFTGIDRAKAIQTLRETGKFRGDVVQYRKDGKSVHFESTVIAIGNRKGVITECVSVNRDVTERKKTEEALRASEEKHRVISGVTADFVFSCVKMGEGSFAIDWMGGATERIFGYSAKEIRDKGCWRFLVHPQDLSIFEEKVTGLRLGQSSVCELRITHKDGSTRWIKASSRVAKDSINPTHHRLFGACEDITERKKAEDSLRESEKKYHSLHSSMSEGVALHEITYDGLGKAVDYIILDVNPAFESIIGIKKEKAVGSKASELYETGKPPYLEIYAEVAASGKPTSFETYFPPMRKHFSISVFSPARGKFATVFYDITERKKAELELQESEKKYRELADQLPVIVYEIDDKERLTFVNDKGFEMTGYSREDLEKGLNIIQMVASEDREKAKARIQRTLNGEKIGYNEYTVIRKDDSRFPAIVRGDAIVQEGKIVGLRSIVIDITERKKAELSLKESEEKFRNLAESSPNMIFINRKGRVVYTNTKAEQMMGYTKEEFYASDFNFLSLITPESRSIVESSFSKHQDGEEVDPYGYELVTKMGRKFHGLINTKLVTYDGEQAILGVVTDVSEMKDAEKLAKESLQKFAALFSGNPEATVYLDTGMHVLDVNPRFTCLFGYSLEEARGKHIDDLVVPENLLEEGRKLGREAAEGYVYHDTVRKTKEGILIPVSVSAAPVYVQSELKGYVWLYKDISQQKSAETKLAMTNEKLKVISGLTRHDVRNKLSTITGNAYMLKKQLADNKEVLDKIRDIETAVSQVTRIFDFAKNYEMLGVEELTYIDVQKSVNEAVQFFSDLNGVRILNECHGLTVLSDSLLRQLFYNLIDNSLKYGKKLSQIRIHYEKAEGNQLRLIYEDDGVGISKDAKPKLFSEGFTAGKGSGYGLYLVKRMMEVYGWTIQETGTPDNGVCFTIVIPENNQDCRENYQLH